MGELMREYAGKLVARERVQKPGRDADRSVPAIAAGGGRVGARAIDDIEPRRRYRCALRELVQDSATSCGALPASTSRPPRLFGATRGRSRSEPAWSPPCRLGR